MNNVKLPEVPKTPSEQPEIDFLGEKVIVRIIAKIADLDDQITGLVGIRVGLTAEIEDMQQRLGDLETKCAIISKKLDQSSFPSLLDEFIKAKRTKKAIQKQKPARKKKK